MMKKYFSNIFALAALLMAGAAFTACSSDDNSIEQPANPVGEKTYTLTINASKGANASTRALALDGTKLVASWENGDVLSVYNKTKGKALTGSLTAKNANGGTATFSGSLTGTIEAGDVLALSYHQPTGMSDYSAQAGTLASAAARDYAIAQVTVASVNAGEITISETSASFLTQTAMLKLTLQDNAKPTPNPLNATQLKVSATMTVASLSMTEDIATFTLAPATYTTNGDGILYFALPSKTNVAAALVDKIKAKVPSIAAMVTIDAVMTALNGATLTYTATVGSDTYTATKTNGYTFAPGKYYAGTLTMKKALTYPIALSAVTSDYIGSVVTTDGNVYATATDAVTASKLPVAMIAYVSGTGHGLALALADEASQINWDTANGASGAAAHTPIVTGYSWKLPSKDDWENMINAAGGYEALRDGFSSVGGNNLEEEDYYWSSTDYEDDSNKAWYYYSDGGYFGYFYKDFDILVRACLAF